MHKPPSIGMRIIKSAVAVFLCFALSLLRSRFFPFFGEGVPFYSAIAAILCMQPYVSGSVKTALNRTVGTVIGAAGGTLFLLAERGAGLQGMPLLRDLLLALCIIPLLYVTVVLKKTTASYITCVVFLSITVSHAADVNPYLFALNRMADTLIGIFVSLLVNVSHLPRRRDRKTLFVLGLDGGLAPVGEKVSAGAAIRFNRLVEQGALVTVASFRSPAQWLPRVEGLDLQLPVLIMNGAALYDRRTHTYLYTKPLPNPVRAEVEDVFRRFGLNCFQYAVVHEVMHVYYGVFTNPAEKDLVLRMRGNAHENFVCGPLPAGHEALRILALDTETMIDRLALALEALPCAERIRLVRRPCRQQEGYDYIGIYPVEASPAAALTELKKRVGADRAVVFGGNERDIPLLEAADRSYASANAVDAVQAAVDRRLPAEGGEGILRAAEKLFIKREH